MRLRRRQREERGFRYSAWDGTQRGFDLDADALLDEMTDDLLYHGDLHAAMRRMMQQAHAGRQKIQSALVFRSISMTRSRFRRTLSLM